MSHLKSKIRQLFVTAGLAALALTLMSACATHPASTSTSAEDEIRLRKAEERAARRDPPVLYYAR